MHDVWGDTEHLAEGPEPMSDHDSPEQIERETLDAGEFSDLRVLAGGLLFVVALWCVVQCFVGVV